MINKNNRTKRVYIRLTEGEYHQLQKQFKGTTEHKLSAYARKMILQKPLIAGYRNLTAEALMIEFARLIKDLNGVANNFNQAVHVLHTLQHPAQFSKWLQTYQQEKNILLRDIQSIRDFINKTAGIWLQS
ncbi:plasmid mobilization protein [Chitinophaga sp. MM2321]|uniref:plasmid mobilization protein n=1 Tax=Chitinophaga sp. MM2321 TaxID=3137178 RepID=UPI0032D5A521